jgi:hypothetical protein
MPYPFLNRKELKVFRKDREGLMVLSKYLFIKWIFSLCTLLSLVSFAVKGFKYMLKKQFDKIVYRILMFL